MHLRITYVHHNCFVLSGPGRTFLFDYPDADNRPPEAEALVRDLIADRNLYICVSHGHGDHFTPEVTDLAATADTAAFVLSYDVADLYEDHFEGYDRVWIIEPDESTKVDDMTVRGFESTDMGVGFLIEWNHKTIWFGGDVADWTWPEQDKQSRQFAADHFGRTIAALRQAGPASLDLAFSNADKRLPNWAGGVRFVQEVRPRFFVPMHTFGQTETLREFAEALGETETVLARYEELGDVVDVEV